MKHTLAALALTSLLASPAFAIDVGSATTTNTTTNVLTDQNTGVSLSGKAKVLPGASISTGDAVADTDVRTSVDADSRAAATRSDTRIRSDVRHSNNRDNDHRGSGKGHKRGHDRD